MSEQPKTSAINEIDQQNMYEYYMDQIKLGESARSKFDTEAKISLDIYKRKEGDDDSKILKVNLHKSVEDTISPKLVLKGGKIVVTPKGPNADEAELKAAECQTVLYRELAKYGNFERVFRKASKDARLKGASITVVNYSADDGKPFIENWPTENFIVNSKTKGSIKTADFIAKKTVMRWDKAKRYWKANAGDSDFNQNFIEYAQPIDNSPSAGRLDNEEYTDRLKNVNLYEIWSKDDNGCVATICPEWDRGVARYQAKWPVPLEPQEFPAIRLSFDPESDDFWTLSDYHSNKDVYQFVNDAVRFIMEQSKYNASQKVLYDEAKFSNPEDAAKLVNGVSEKIPIKGDPEKAVFKLDFGALNASVVQALQIVKQIGDEVIGVGEDQRGGRGRRKTATEASILEDWSNARIDNMRRIIDVYYIPEVATKVLQYAAYLMRKEDVAGLVGEELAQYWFESPVEPEEYRKMFTITLEPGTTRQRQQREEIGKALELLNSIRGDLQAMGGGTQLLKLVENVCRAFYEDNWEQFTITIEEMQERQKQEEEQQQEQQAAMAKQAEAQNAAVVEQSAQLLDGIQATVQKTVESTIKETLAEVMATIQQMQLGQAEDEFTNVG